MNNLPRAEISPRIVNGVLKWYEGDTFSLQIELELEDQDGEPITIQPEDTVKVVFKNKSLRTVKEFTFTGIKGNTIHLEFDKECTDLFEKGNYTYDIIYITEEIKTIAATNKVVIE